LDKPVFQREFERRLRVGMVGIGQHSYRSLLSTMHYLPVQLEAISAHSDESRARDTAREYGCRYYMSPAAMYEKEELDAVFVCVAPEHHPDLVCEAFDAGLHVWLEKPPAMRAEGVQRMLDRRGDRIAVVGFKKAFMPVVDKAREIVASPQYGELRSLLGIYPMSIPADGEAVLAEQRFTNWLANGVHPLSFLMEIGGSVESVTAHCGPQGHGAFVLRFRSGVIGTFHMASGPLPMESYCLYGEGWHCDITNNTRLALYRDYGPKNGATFLPEGFDTGAIVWEAQNCLATIENKSLFTQGIYAEMKHFCDLVLEGRRAERGSLEFALELMKVYEAGLVSHGRTVQIE
jgi:predicted dehydrogenase